MVLWFGTTQHHLIFMIFLPIIHVEYRIIFQSGNMSNHYQRSELTHPIKQILTSVLQPNLLLKPICNLQTAFLHQFVKC